MTNCTILCTLIKRFPQLASRGISTDRHYLSTGKMRILTDGNRMILKTIRESYPQVIIKNASLLFFKIIYYYYYLRILILIAIIYAYIRRLGYREYETEGRKP